MGAGMWVWVWVWVGGGADGRRGAHGCGHPGFTCCLLACSQAARHIAKMSAALSGHGGRTDGRTARYGDLVPVQLSARVSGEGNAPAPPVDDSDPTVHSI